MQTWASLKYFTLPARARAAIFLNFFISALNYENEIVKQEKKSNDRYGLRHSAVVTFVVLLQ